MSIKSLRDLINEFKQQDAICNGNHDLEDKPSSFGCAGRFGGRTYSLYKCKKCGSYIRDEKEYQLASSYYDKDGRPFKNDKKIPQSCYNNYGCDLNGCSKQEDEGCYNCELLE